jgi:hypothetical protein
MPMALKRILVAPDIACYIFIPFMNLTSKIIIKILKSKDIVLLLDTA